MKRTKKCPKCDSLRIGHLAFQIDHDDTTRGPVESYPGAAITKPAKRLLGYQDKMLDTGFWKYGDVHPLVGPLEAYVCTDCGYHETYVVEPRNVEWAKLVGFSWVNSDAPSSGPFR